MKHAGQAVIQVMRGFARQRWRAWIETGQGAVCDLRTLGSPVSDGGRGLKLGSDGLVAQVLGPEILFPYSERVLLTVGPVRPSAMAGVD